MKTSQKWWEETKNDEAKLNRWLQRQYVGEFAAVNLLSEILLRFGSEMTHRDRHNVFRVMTQEALHGSWMSELLTNRDLQPETDGVATQRYWAEVLPNVNSFKDAMQAAMQAESMRLHRIRAIAADEEAPEDIRRIFKAILPHEEWHERVFGEMKGDHYNETIANDHEKGLGALSLVLA